MRPNIKIILFILFIFLIIFLIVFLIVFFVIKKSDSNEILNENIVKKYHVVMTTPRYYNEDKTKGTIFNNRVLYYAGYIYVNNDKVEYVPVNIKKERGPHLISPRVFKSHLDYVIKKSLSEDNPTDFILNNFETFSIRFIKDKVGEKYFKNNKFIEDSYELHDAIINKDKF